MATSAVCQAGARIAINGGKGLTDPHRKQSGVRSGDLTGHVVYGDSLRIHLAGNCSSNNERTLPTKCGGAHLTLFTVGIC